jgi:hypothetical protein
MNINEVTIVTGDQLIIGNNKILKKTPNKSCKFTFSNLDNFHRGATDQYVRGLIRKCLETKRFDQTTRTDRGWCIAGSRFRLLF